MMGPPKACKPYLLQPSSGQDKTFMKDSNDDAAGQRTNLHTQSALGGT